MHKWLHCLWYCMNHPQDDSFSDASCTVAELKAMVEKVTDHMLLGGGSRFVMPAVQE